MGNFPLDETCMWCNENRYLRINASFCSYDCAISSFFTQNGGTDDDKLFAMEHIKAWWLEAFKEEFKCRKYI